MNETTQKQIPMHLIPIRIVLLVVMLISLTGCPVVHIPAAYGTLDISDQDFDDLRDGNLLAVKDRYEAKKNELNNKELALLCDIYVRHMSISDAFECLDDLEKRSDSEDFVESVNGKRALIYYILGNYEHAKKLSKDLESDGGRYIYSLSEVQLGNPQIAIDNAHLWMLSYEPPQVFLAANLFLATGNYAKVLESLQEPERRLDRDYSLSGGMDIFGIKIDPAPLRVDMFGEFGFGLFDTFSFAPQGNVYVEYALAKSDLETGVIDQARERYDLILGFPGIEAYRDILWRVLFDRGKIAENDNKNENAKRFYKESITVIESARSSITTDSGRIGFVIDKQDVYNRLIGLLLELGETKTAFEYSERARSRALVDLLASVENIGVRGDLSKNYQKTVIKEYEQAEIRLTDAQVQTVAETEVDRRRGLTIEGRRAVAKSLNSEVASMVSVIPPDLDDILENLLPDEGLLSYDKGINGWGVFLVTKDTGVQYINLTDADLDQQINNFLDAIRKETDSNDTQYREFARILYDHLFGPVADKLRKNIKKLTIIPYDRLYYLPFSALLSPGNEFLVEKYTIAVLPSAAIRQYLTPEQQWRPRGILAVGDPKREDVGPLPGSNREADSVANIYRASARRTGRSEGQDEVLKQEFATRTIFLQAVPGKKIVHIASHGEFNPKLPLQSRLLLGPDEANGDLTVYKLLEIEKPWGNALIVLSACQSSLADIKAGGEIIGLQRGFFFAGTDAIVGTLWRISDNATADLMEQFYKRFSTGTPPAKALRLAQIDIQKQERYKHPKDWAAFVYTGLHPN